MNTAHGKDSIVLIDGEHYPPVIARAIKALRERGENPVLALLVGGKEKLSGDFEVGLPREQPQDAERGLADVLERSGIRRVIDLSDEPVLGYEARCRLASIALWRGASYEGADFSLRPPSRDLHLSQPSVGVIGSGKRTGKTAVAAATARAYKERGLNPVIVAMGRGGPPDPEVIEAGMALDPKKLLEWSKSGRHAASDYIEDAITSGVATVGAWRAGGGLAGEPFVTNFEAAVAEAEKLTGDLLILEGSGAAIPPAHWDAGILVVNASVDPHLICGYFGLYRVLLADLVVLTMVEESVDADRLAEVTKCILNRPLNPPKVIRTTFRPYPIGEVEGKRVWVATTAPHEAKAVLTKHLQDNFGSKVVGISHALADRESLRNDLEMAAAADVFLVEVKAAGVDVVTEYALANGIEVIFIDNRPETVGGDEPFDRAVAEVAALAKERFSQ